MLLVQPSAWFSIEISVLNTEDEFSALIPITAERIFGVIRKVSMRRSVTRNPIRG